MIKEGDRVRTPSGLVGTVLRRRGISGQCVIWPDGGTDSIVEFTDSLIKEN